MFRPISGLTSYSGVIGSVGIIHHAHIPYSGYFSGRGGGNFVDMDNFVGLWNFFVVTCTCALMGVACCIYGNCFVGKYFVVCFSTRNPPPPPRKILTIQYYIAGLTDSWPYPRGGGGGKTAACL